MSRIVRDMALVALVGVLVTGCARGGGEPAAGGGAGEPVASTAATPTASATAGDFSPTDIAWTQLMIALDDKTLLLVDLTPKQTTDPDLRGVAERVGTDHRAELARLRQLLAQAGVAESNEHEGHDMPGMVTADDLRALTAATGPAFDQLFVTNMRDHLEQTVRLARAVRQSGHEPHVRELAGEIEQIRATQLDQLATVE
jgi:uncharacterized protein (DUF305 family)